MLSSLRISDLIKKKPGPQDGSIAQQASSGRVGTDLHMTGLTAGDLSETVVSQP